MAGSLAQMICHPAEIWLLPKMPLCDSLPLPLKCWSSFHLTTRPVGYPYSLPPMKTQNPPAPTPASDSGTVADGSLRRETTLRGSRSECVPLRSIQSLIITNKGGGGHVEFSSYGLYAIACLAGTTPKGLSIFRNGNAMCEN